MIRLPPRSTLFPYRRSSDLLFISFLASFNASAQGYQIKIKVKGLKDTTCYLAYHYGDKRYLKEDRKSTRLNSSHVRISYAVFCLKKLNKAPPDHSSLSN